MRLATSGNGDVLLRVTGRASHAGSAPEQGRNALYELAHQIMQMRDLSDPALGLKLNWTVATAGTVRNIIPALETRAAVMEGFGLVGAGAHSNDAEFIYVSSIEPRLYLLSRMIMDVAARKAAAGN